LDYTTIKFLKSSQNARKSKLRRQLVKANSIRDNDGDCELHEHREIDRAFITEDQIVDREERRIALFIAEFICSKLSILLGPSSRKAVSGRVLDHKKVCGHLPNHILHSKVLTAYEEVVGGISACLDLVKRANSAVKLATKHAILDAVVSSGMGFSAIGTGQSSLRHIRKVLQIHPCNLAVAISRREVMDNNEVFVCTL